MFLVSVGAGSLAAGVMSLFNSAAINGFFGSGTLAVLWAWTAWRGYTCVRAGDYASHQAWMIRTAYVVLPFLSWLPNLLVAELLVRRRGLPALALTPSPTTPGRRLSTPDLTSAS